ncbi:hypothetical protein ACJRW5_07885 [Pseudomonas sp. SH1-B]
MRKSLRTALIWMLMLALPAQAMAALGMQLCQQVHSSSALQMSPGEHAEHGMGHGMAAADNAGSEHHGMTVTASDTGGDSGFCNLCAFCVGVAAPSEPFLNHSIVQTIEPALAWPERLVLGVADTPERPPRFFLA